jgi:hypothetical protein
MTFQRPGGASLEVAGRDPAFASATDARRGPQASPLEPSSQATHANAWTLAPAQPSLRRRLYETPFPGGNLRTAVKSEQHGGQYELGTE